MAFFTNSKVNLTNLGVNPSQAAQAAPTTRTLGEALTRRRRPAPREEITDLPTPPDTQQAAARAPLAAGQAAQRQRRRARGATIPAAPILGPAPPVLPPRTLPGG